MKVVEYNSPTDIFVEFQDKYKARVHTSYHLFLLGGVRNPYHTSVYNVGIVGNKYPVTKNGKETKEYRAWHGMIERCYSEKKKEQHPTYKDVTCCEEWLLYENFYEWLHSQENFDKWLNGNRWAVDKDILIKGNKVYSPETCCLVPHIVNSLFVFQNKDTGLPVGVRKYYDRFIADSHQFGNNNSHHIGIYDTKLDAFNAYRLCKEQGIKEVAIREFTKNNITLKCYEAMMNYKIEIND